MDAEQKDDKDLMPHEKLAALGFCPYSVAVGILTNPRTRLKAKEKLQATMDLARIDLQSRVASMRRTVRVGEDGQMDMWAELDSAIHERQDNGLPAVDDP